MTNKPSSSTMNSISASFVSTIRDTRDADRKRKLTTGSATASSDPTTSSNANENENKNPVLLRYEISNFSKLPHTKGNFVESRSIRILDKLWHLRVYPRGHGLSRSDKVLVSCFLTIGNNSQSLAPQLPRGIDNNDDDDNDFEFSFRIRNWRMVPKRCGFRSDVALYGFMGHSRENILRNGLEADGTLVVEIALKFLSSQQQRPMRSLSLLQHNIINNNTLWNTNHPNKRQKQQRNNNRTTNNICLAEQLFWSREFADLSFLVGQTVFKAHKCVLALRARTLLELALHDDYDDESDSGDDNSMIPLRDGHDPPLQLPNVQEDVFQSFLDYVYTSNEERLLLFLGITATAETNRRLGRLESAKSLLVVADKFGATELKDFLESVLVSEFLSEANCCELLILADSHWCKLLKKEALNLYCSSSDMSSILEDDNKEQSSSGWKLLQESPKLLSELLVKSTQTTSAQHQRLAALGEDTFLRNKSLNQRYENRENVLVRHSIRDGYQSPNQNSSSFSNIRHTGIVVQRLSW